MRKKGQRIVISAILLVLVFSFCTQPLSVMAATLNETAALTASGVVKIVTQPTSVSAPLGENATVKVVASGEGLSYQWYYKNATNQAFHKAEDFTTDTYTVPMSNARNGRQLYCVITDKYGNQVKTNTVTITMGNPLSISKQPQSAYVAMGATAKVTVAATGDGLSYQWYYKEKNQTKFYLTTSFKSNTYSVEMTDARNGRQLYCVVTDKYGNSVKTDVVTIGMKATLIITKQPQSVKVPIGDEATVKVVASGEGLTYQWYYKNTTNQAFHKAEDFTTDTYSVPMSNARNGRQLYCVITDQYGNSVKSDVVTLKMGQAVTITKQPTSVSGFEGDKVTVSFTATGDGLTYKWYVKNAGNKKFYPTDSFKGASYSVVMNEERNGRQLYCVITDQYGNSVQTEVVTIRLSQTLAITTQPQSVTALNGQTATVKVEAVGEGLTYKWYYKNADNKKFALTTKFTGSTYSVEMSDKRSGRQIYCVVTDKYGNSVTTNTVTLKMGTAATITKQPVSVKGFDGDKVTVSFTAAGDGLTYKWYVKNPGNSKFYPSDSFKGSAYSVNMNASRDGRQLYCVVTDQYGNSVQTDTVTIGMNKTVQITKQPQSVTGKSGATVVITVGATGDGLTYKWYYKNADNKKFALTTKFTGNTYSVEMSSARDGRQIYCVVTDQYGNSVQTVTVVLSMVHTHKLGEWEVIREATPEAEGRKRASCACGYYEEESIAKVKAVRYITVDLGNGETYKIGVGSNGAYYLDDPYRSGYNFLGWKDFEGKDFPASGKVSANTKIYARWELDGTDTLGELINRAGEGADKIVITGDIIVNKPIYVPYATTIYSDGDYSITRAPGYDGDIFVVGQDMHGNSSVVNNHQAVLTLGGGKGTLTIDGNRDNLTVTVVGSAIYAVDSCVVNLYDGIRIVNHMKLGNKRTYTEGEKVSDYTATRAGGAAILILDSTVNMYGGVIDNNKVYTEYTEVTNDDGTISKEERYACGGAIFNRGNFNMYGGTISNNEGLRGGAIFTDRIVYLYAGNICNNIATVYGGAVASSSSVNADTHIGNDDGRGTMIIKGNHSYRAGGAIYSNTNSPIVVYGNTEFIENVSDTSGGAIYTAGGLTVRGAKFVGNKAVMYSGGAIYHHYTKAEFNRRYLTLENCVFEENESGLGGAICMSSSGTVVDEGTIAFISDCQFLNNHAVKTEYNAGNGGALYITRYSDATITNCTFSGNTAAQNSGAVSIHSSADVDMKDCTFVENKALFGGAGYFSSGATVDLKNVSFDGNTAAMNETGSGGNGGALYIYGANITFNNVDLTNNAAANNAGAVYLGATELVLDNTCQISGNTAGNHGGAFYLTYKTLEDGTKDGAVLKIKNMVFENNSALAGGAISARSASELIMTNVTFRDNSTPGAKVGSSNGGGAIFSNNSTIKATDVTFEENSSGYYGGVLRLDSCVTEIKDCTFTGNSGGTGGAVYASKGSFVMDKVSITDNTSTLNGVFYLTGVEITMTNITATGNYAPYGGVLYTNGGATATVKGWTASDNNAKSGAVIYAAGSSTVNVTESDFAKNAATAHGGAIYLIGSNLTVGTGTTFTGNTAGGNGGAVAAYDLVNETTQEKTGSNVTITGVPFDSNVGACGGAVYFNDSVYSITDCTFTGNAATSESYGGGAVYNTGATGTIDQVTFTGNTALNGGAMAMYTGSKATISNVTATGNKATGSGGVFYSNNCQLTVATGEVELTGNSAKLGGAIYMFRKDLVLENAVLKDNTSESNGGAIVIVGATLTIKGDNTQICGNTAAGHGGAIYASYFVDDEGVRHGATLNITGVTIDGNTALYGGAISGRTNTVMNLTDVVFKNNTTPDANSENKAGGGAIYSNNSVINLSGVTMTGNSSGYYGGGIKTEACEVITKDGTVFDGNTGGTGAAMHLSEGSSLVAEDLTVINNVSTANGVIYLNGKTFTFTNLSAHDNSAAWSGGVMFVSGGKTNVTVKDSKLEKNSSGNGGAIYVSSGTVTVTNSDLTNNTAKNGGAIYAMGSAAVNVEDSNLANNTAKNGGAINAVNGSVVNVADSKLSGNSATSGGAAMIQGASLNVTGVTVFENNVSSGNGGAIYVGDFTEENADGTVNTAKSSVNIVGAAFESNSGSTGGAIYVNNNEYTIKDSQFLNNTATALNYGGGAIYTTRGIGHLEGITFTGNSSVKGGAVALHTNSEMTVTSMVATGNSAVTNEEGNFGIGGVFFVNNSTLNLNGTEGSIIFGTAESGNTAVTGAAIRSENSATVHVSGAVFTNHKLTSNGGAIYAANSTLTLTDSVFTGNSAANGGAIYSKRCTVTMTDCTFTENTASSNGGAIDFVASVVTAEGENTFTNNSAGNHGGAIYVVYDTETKEDGSKVNTGTEMTMTGGTFSGNTAMGGGAVSIRSHCSVTFNGTVFTKNTVIGYADENDGDGEGGGAIYMGYGSVELINVTATGNTADGFGGFMSAVSGKVVINGGSFSENSAMCGGAINAQSGCKVTIANAELKSNASTYENKDYNNSIGGGAVCIAGGSLTISNTKLTDNTTGYYGGTILASGTDVTIDQGTLVSGSTGSTGAAVFLKNKCTALLKDIIISGNTADSNGVVYANSCTLTMENVTASGNKANFGGVIYVSNGSTVVNATNCTFSGNTAKKGGVVYCDSATVTFNSCNVSDNTATNGGAFYSENGTLKINGGQFTKNTASNGGVVYVIGAVLEITDATMDSNSATSFGGAVYCYDTEATLTRATFNANTAASNGGAIYMSGSHVSGTDNIFSNNTASGHGGAIYVVYFKELVEEVEQNVPGILELNGGSFTYNTALNGGAISARTDSVVTLTNVVLDHNSTPDATTENKAGGGAIYCNNTTLTLDGCTVSNNSSGYYGGAIKTELSVVTMTNTTLEGNSGATGAAMYMASGSSLTATDVKLLNNTAKANGVLYLNGKDFTFVRLTASGNEASWNGGAIYVNGSNTVVSVTDSVISGNSSDKGGAFQLINGTLNLINSEVSQNTATEGGAIYLTTGTVNINGSVLSSNTADMGGAIYAEDGIVTINGATLSENSAVNGGAVAIVNGAQLNLIGTAFNGNEATSGGAIDVQGAVLNVGEGTTFTGNTATGNGGAIHVVNYIVEAEEGSAETVVNSTVVIDGAIFDGNTGKRGGALYISENHYTVSNTEFKNNSTTDTAYGGSAIYSTVSVGTLENVTLTGNISVKGGAIALHSKSELTVTSLVATGNQAIANADGKFGVGGVFFVNNSTLNLNGTDGSIVLGTAEAGNHAVSGGAVYAENNATVTISGTVFEGNTADKSGAAVYASNAGLTVSDSKFLTNTAGVYAGAVFSSGSSIELNRNTFTGNTATGNGGAVYIANATSADLTGNTFTGNSTKANGGAINFYATTATLTDNDFVNNHADAHGGAVYATYQKITNEDKTTTNIGSNLTVNGGSFEGNTAMGGGAISIRTSCEATFNETTFTGNSVSGCDSTNDGVADGDGEGGGAIYVGYGSVALNDVTASGNIAETHGGFLDAYRGVVTVNGGTYSNHTASIAGGVIFADNKSAITITDASFDGNQTTDKAVKNHIGGGVIQIIESTLDISGSTFSGNSSYYYGGVLLADKATVTIKDSTITGSNGRTGAALYFKNGCVATLQTVELKENNGKGNGLIYINSGTLTMSNVTATGNTSTNGGVLYVSGSSTVVTVNDAVFAGNEATTSGGAIYLTNGKVIMTGGEVKNNSAPLGGAIYNLNGTLEISGVTFLENEATGDTGNGGAIALEGGSVTGNGNTFSGNTATNGGAIHVNSVETMVNSVVNLTETTYNGNTAVMGGAVYAEGGEVTLTNASFTGNTATDGGAVAAVHNAVVSLIGGALENNEASYGAAVYVAGAELHASGGTAFKGNTATGNGGAIYECNYYYKATEDATEQTTVKSNVTIDGAVFECNTANQGGAIYVTGNTYSVKNAQFLSNSATNASYGGGAIYTTGGIGTLDNVTFTGNSSVKGGAVALHSKSEMTVTSMVATGNSAVTNAEGKLGVGGVFFVNNSTLNLNGEDGSVIFGSAESGNTAVTGGAIRIENGATVHVSGAVFTNHKLTSNGGAIYAANSTLTLTDSVFTGNAAYHGGAIYSKRCTVTMTDCTFAENTASSNGGGIYFEASTVTAEGENSFTNNSAVNHGGAIYVVYVTETKEDGSKVNIGTEMTMTGGTFSGNIAMGGGAVSIRSYCSVTFNGTVFTKNTVIGYAGENDGDGEGGGAIYMGYGSVELINVTATGNTADGFGGFMSSVSGNVVIDGGSFSENSAMCGGAINAQSGCKVTVSGATFDSNESTYVQSGTYNSNMGGGAINIVGGKLIMSETTLKANKTGFYGGAVLADGTTVEITDGEITENIGQTGGVLYFKDGCQVTITGSSLSKNTSDSNGLIYVLGGTTVIENCTVTENDGASGGLLFASGTSTVVNINNCTMTGNTANIGGLIYGNGATVTVNGGEMSGNTANYGGVVYVSSGTVNLNNVLVSGNSATKNGGAIYVIGGTLNISSGRYENNSATGGGVIAINYGGVANVENTVFDSNSATGDGGAIYVLDSSENKDMTSTLNMSGTTLSNNTSGSKGGALATAYGAPNLVVDVEDCIFEGNTSKAGGGAVEIQNTNCNSAEDPTAVTIVFTNCTFTKNTAGSTGGAIEIRSQSCAKFDGITATGNSAKNNGGVIYVTSNYSRLYLTGTVTISENTCSNGNFVYLYNNNYTNPPKLYTTDSSSAAWYTEVKGNRTNVAFDLTTLP